MTIDCVRLLCVDDNRLVLEALTMRLKREPSVEVVATLEQADDLPQTAMENEVDVVLLDVDMPGRDAFEALADLARQRPQTRTIIVSGYVRTDLIDRAIASGAWGYLNKTAGVGAILDAIHRVREGEFAFGPDLPTNGHGPQGPG